MGDGPPVQGDDIPVEFGPHKINVQFMKDELKRRDHPELINLLCELLS